MSQLVLTDRYFSWLYDSTGLPRDMESAESYTTVCQHMHALAFLALVPHDENRVIDAELLRTKYATEAGRTINVSSDHITPPVTIFEVLLALATRAAFMVDSPVSRWFRIFIENLDLVKYSDVNCLTRSTWPLDRRLKTFNNRAYSHDGRGGLFPLQHPKVDQRELELWYQMGAFMTENRMY